MANRYPATLGRNGSRHDNVYLAGESVERAHEINITIYSSGKTMKNIIKLKSRCAVLIPVLVFRLRQCSVN